MFIFETRATNFTFCFSQIEQLALKMGPSTATAAPSLFLGLILEWRGRGRIEDCATGMEIHVLGARDESAEFDD